MQMKTDSTRTGSFCLPALLLLSCLAGCSASTQVHETADDLRNDYHSNVTVDDPKNDYHSNEEIAAAADNLYAAYREQIADRQNELSEGKITIDGVTVSLSMQQIGKPDENGYPLYIALRGGGVDDAELAREQYQLMQEYYTCSIRSGIYVVTQPYDCTWNEHYLPEMYRVYDRIIEDAAAFYDVDINRVYLLGFSSGGDGVYCIAPSMADRFAAVNMSAGTPHIFRLGNLYHLPMCIQMGENDTAYDRNILAAQFDASLSDHARRYGGGFPHETFLHVGGDHNNWSDVLRHRQEVYTGDQVAVWADDPKKASSVRVNTSAIDWVDAYTRDPLPERLVWEPHISVGARNSQAFYWLDRDGDLPDTTIVASYHKSDNSITLEECDAECGTLKIYLNPQMLDVFQDVTVNICGEYTLTVHPVVSAQIMESTLHARGDKNFIFTSEIDVTFHGEDAPTAEAAEQHVTDYTLKDSSRLLYWNEDGLFYVDPCLFGLTLQQLTEKLGVELRAPERWDHWGNQLSCTALGFGEKTVYFLFQNSRCMFIVSEEAGTVSSTLSDSAKKHFGTTTNALVADGLCWYKVQDNFYNDSHHIQQRYKYYQYIEY